MVKAATIFATRFKPYAHPKDIRIVWEVIKFETATMTVTVLDSFVDSKRAIARCKELEAEYRAVN